MVHGEGSGRPQSISTGQLGLPSIGSAGHQEGTCKRCCFFPRGRCSNGSDCEFCHLDHEKRIRKSKNARRLAKLVAQAEAKLQEISDGASPTILAQFVATPTSSVGGRADMEQSCHVERLSKASLHAGAASFQPSWQAEQGGSHMPDVSVAESRHQQYEGHATCENSAQPQMPQAYFAMPTADQYGVYVHQGLEQRASCGGWPSVGVAQAENFVQGSLCQDVLASQSLQCMQAYGWAGAQQTSFLEMGSQEQLFEIQETCTIPQALPMQLRQSAVQLMPR